MMSASFVETLFSGSHLKRDPRAILLLKLRGYLTVFGHCSLSTQSFRPVQEIIYVDLSSRLASATL
jgi:hypothetical protein